MASGEVLQSFGDLRQKLHRLLRDGASESADGLVQTFTERLNRNSLKSLDQSVLKAVQPVTMADDALAFYVVENFADLSGCTLAVIQKRNKIGDSAFEINVIFPERVIGIDQQRLRIWYWCHINMIRFFLGTAVLTRGKRAKILCYNPA